MSTQPLSSSDPLFDIERRIARRADQLARQSRVVTTQSLAPWHRAEKEVWASLALDTRRGRKTAIPA